MDLTEMYNSQNFDDAATILTEKFLGVADKHAPKVTIRVKNRINNIFSDELLLLMKEIDHAKVISARTGREEDWLKYRKLRNKVNNKKNQEKKSHFNELIENSKDDPKQMWKNLKELVPNKITKQSQIKRLEINGNDETDSLKIAEHFNHYFVNIASKLAEKFKRVTSTQATLPNQTTSVLHFQQVSSQKVYTFIKELKNGKSTGIDGISVKLLKAGAKSLSPAWQIRHKARCTLNHKGSSGAMQLEGLRDIFNRSETKYGVRYTKFIGEGDSSSYSTICEEKSYGPDVSIEKKECVGHAQKRLGKRFRNFKSNFGNRKLKDGKTIGGKGRLTKKVIDKMNNYYGLAIRQNKNNLDGMINDVMAGLNQQMVLHHQMQNHNITNVQKEIHLGVVGKDSKQRIEKITNTRM
eukprot:gene2897-3348_t